MFGLSNNVDFTRRWSGLILALGGVGRVYEKALALRCPNSANHVIWTRNIEREYNNNEVYTYNFSRTPLNQVIFSRHVT